MKLITIITILFSSILAAHDGYCSTDALTNNSFSRQYYNVGDMVSEEDQNHFHNVCHGDGNYEIDSSFRLSDYGGDIILISMNATW